MDDIIHDVIVGFLIIVATSVILLLISQFGSSMRNMSNKVSDSEQYKYEDMDFDDVQRYENQNRKFNGKEVLDFISYHSVASSLNSIRVQKLDNNYIIYDPNNEATKKAKKEEITSYIYSNIKNNVELMEVEYSFDYDDGTKTVSFKLN